MKLLRIPEERTSILLKNGKKNLKTIEISLHVKINADKSGEVEVSGTDPLEELLAYNIIKAIGRGFSAKKALNLLEDNSELLIVDIKDFVNSENSIIRLKGRVIGKSGKIRSFLEKELNIDLCIYGKTISIIGNQNNVEIARQVIFLLLKGGSYAAMRKLIQKNYERLR